MYNITISEDNSYFVKNGNIEEDFLLRRLRSVFNVNYVHPLSDSKFHFLMKCCLDDDYVAINDKKSFLDEQYYRMKSRGIDYVQWYYYPLAVLKFLFAIGFFVAILNMILKRLGTE